MNIHYENDLRFRLNLKDSSGNVVIPTWDFELQFFVTSTGSKKTATQINGVMTNMKIIDSHLWVFLNNTNFGIGELQCKFINLMTDPDFSDDNRKQIIANETGITLVEGNGDDNTTIDVDMMIDYAIVDMYEMAVKKGYTGTKEDYITALSDMPAAVKAATDATSNLNVTIKNAEDATKSANDTNSSIEDAEKLRVKAEESRVIAENNRELSFSDSKSACDKATDASINQTSICKNETDKTIALEISVGEKETERQSAEVTRNNNESVRIENEIVRNSSEGTRTNSEKARIDSENIRKESELGRIESESSRSLNEQSRIDAENIRVEAENTRLSNENTRKQSEIQRVSNEDNRVDAEKLRVDAENARVISENNRIDAEKLRVQEEKKRESDFSASKEACDTATANCNTSLSALSVLTANYMIVGMAKIAGDADPAGSKFYGKDENIPLIFNHVRMGLVKAPSGTLYKWCDKLRLTKAIDGTTLAIDGTDGDVLLCTDCDIYLYLNNATIDGTEYEVMAIGLVPFSLYGIDAIKLEPHAMTPHTTVNVKLTNDANSQAHSIYNSSAIGSYSTPPAIFKTQFRTNGAGCMNWGISSINSIIQGQNKNVNVSSNYPYAGLFHVYYELLCAMMFIEGKSLNHQDMDKFGGGNTSTYTITSEKFANVTQGNSGVKVIKADATELYYPLMSNNLKINSASSTNIYFLQALVGGSYYAIEEMLEPQRIIDNIAANGNQNNVGSTNIYTNMGATLITDGSINLITGEGMNIGQRYFVVRNVSGFKGLSDGISTCVINCFVKMEFADNTVLGDNTLLTGSKAIYKLSYAMYRGWKLPFGIFTQLQGIHSILHADANGVLTCSIRRTLDYKTLPVITASSTLYGTENTELDMEKGMLEVATGLVASDNWGKKRNITYSMFHPLVFGGGLTSYDCAYNWRSRCYGQGNGLPANGSKCVQSSAVGCYAYVDVASACSLAAYGAASNGHGGFYAGGFALHKLIIQQ